MGAGSKRHGEDEDFTDQLSGRLVTRLTNYKGHSHLLYFTDQYWLDRTRFIFCSDREGASNLFVYDIEERSIQQVTFFTGPHRPEGLYWSARESAFFWYGNDLWEMKIDEFELRLVMRLGEGSEHAGLHAASPDGTYLYTAIRSAPQKKERMHYNKSPDYLDNYTRPQEQRVVAIEPDSGKMHDVLEERNFILHVNSSPTDPDLLTYCHEGPWAQVAQRIWGLQPSTGKTWPIRPQDRDLAVGHEFFTGCGEWVGYHGRRLPDERTHTFGFVRPDNSGMIEHDFPYHCTHFTSYGLDYALGDGTPANVQPWFSTNQRPFLMLFRRTDDGYEGPRVLAFHRSTFNEQFNHPHAQFTPDGTKVLFTSDVGGYSNIYMVEIGAFEELPWVSECYVEWV